MRSATGQFDTSIEIVTPENIAFEYRVAGPFRRLPAFLIDFMIQVFITCIVLLVLAIVLAVIGLGFTWMAGVAAVLWFVLVWFYGGLFEALWNGQTPGKRLMQIRVLSVNGQPINGMQAILRNLLRGIDMQPVFFSQVGLLSCMISDRFQRLGDLACGTMVVVEERQWMYAHGVIRIAEPEARRIVEQIPANFLASRSLARALAAYVQRRRSFAWGRRLEIAQHLGEPLREKFGLPVGTNVDALLCALYHHTFITERRDEPPHEGSPFMHPHVPFAEFAASRQEGPGAGGQGPGAGDSAAKAAGSPTANPEPLISSPEPPVSRP